MLVPYNMVKGMESAIHRTYADFDDCCTFSCFFHQSSKINKA